jgi:serine/threonine protein kinase
LRDVGEHAGTAFLVMELLDGETLEQRLTRGGHAGPPLPLSDALAIAIQITDALAVARRAGIVHRDLKPGNIFLVRTGASSPPIAKLLDFGLAKTSAPPVAVGGATMNDRRYWTNRKGKLKTRPAVDCAAPVAPVGRFPAGERGNSRGRQRMAKFLIQGSYTAEGAKGLIKEGGTGRKAAVEKALVGLGGKVDVFYYAFGTDDVVVICDLPDSITALALSLAVNASAAVRISTTLLASVEDVDIACKKAVSYRPAGS